MRYYKNDLLRGKKRSCEEMNPRFFTAPFLLCFHLIHGSWFRVQGSRGGFAAFFRRWYSRIAAFPSRGRCPAGADRVTMAWKTAGIRFPGHSYESCKSPAADGTRKWEDRYFTSPFLLKAQPAPVARARYRLPAEPCPENRSENFSKIPLQNTAESYIILFVAQRECWQRNEHLDWMKISCWHEANDMIQYQTSLKCQDLHRFDSKK